MHREILTAEELKVLASPTQQEVAASAPPVEPTDRAAANAQKALAELHDSFATTASGALTKIIGRDVQCRLREAVSATFGQFVFAQLVPTCCAVVRAEPIRLEFYLAIEPTVMYPMLDRMLGAKLVDPPPQRPMTEIERGVATLMMNELLAGYSRALQSALSLECHVDRLEHNAQRLKGLPGGEPTYLATYDLRCDADHGRLSICLPWQGTQQIRERLAG